MIRTPIAVPSLPDIILFYSELVFSISLSLSF